MITYYAIPCPDKLRDNFARLIDHLDQGTRDPLAPLLIDVANDYTDVIVQVMVLGNSEMMPPGSMARKVLEGVASIIKGTSHTMNRQVLHKMSNADMTPVANQIRNRRLEVDGKTYISFPVPADLAAAYRRCFVAIRAGDMSVQRDFTDAVLRFSRLAHQHFYVESMHSLKLGMIARKLVDIGGAGIEKASEAAIRKLVPALNAEELLGFVDYLEPLYLDVA
ncbi:MAG TPA: hypothetical protein VFW49_01655 [Fluviicoccus sp.]|jgi:hypothetical protein|nr:hypothetical protein [Fluviicoccus sp.]